MIKTLIFTFISIFIIACGSSSTKKVISYYSDDTSNFVIPINSKQQIHVYAHYSDGSQNEITNSLIWSTSDNSVIVINGLIFASDKEMNVTISYKTKEKLSDGSVAYSNILHYEIKKLALQTITLSSSSISLSVGATTTLTASGIYEDNQSRLIRNIDLNWSTSLPNITKVLDGTITGVSEGEANVTASDGNITSAPTLVKVTKVKFVSISIYAQKTIFNVEQTINLEARAINDKNETVIVDNSLLLWSSSSDNIINVKNGLATALTKGSSKITVILKEDNMISSSLSLVVKKDKYLRLFKDDIEVDFPYVESNEDSKIPEILPSFIIRAVGTDFTVANLKVTKLDGNTSIQNGAIYFDGLKNGYILNIDTNVTFKLKHNGLEDELFYFFDINDSLNNIFSEKYLKTNI